jgi:starch synthase
MILLSHPTGNANVREAARALNENGLLSELWTSLYWRRDHPLNAILPAKVSLELCRRVFPFVDRHRVHCNPWLDAMRLFSNRVGFSGLARHEVGRLSVDAVYRSLDRKVAARLRRHPRPTAVYAYEDGALETFRVARELGIKTIYELPIGYWKANRELMTEEAELQPEWAPTIRGNIDSTEKRKRKDEELALADRIIVASEFVRTTLRKAGPLSAQVSVIPYGAPPSVPAPREPRKPGSKLRIVFVGSLGQRKGVSYLLKAVDQLGEQVELTLIGKPVSDCRPLHDALRTHRWIPSLSHNEVLDEIRRHDVMVFPTLFEGFGLVILEALSCGVPVITTAHTGAVPDLVLNGVNGFIVPIRNADAIAEKLELLFCDPDRLAAMGRAASSSATTHPWECYRNQFVREMQDVLAGDVQEMAVCNS